VTAPFSRELYPFTGAFLEVPGGRMHYLDEGAGEPVLMLHGNPTWSFYYRNLVPRLSDRRRVVVPDHIGCGLSDKPGDDAYPYTLGRRVDDVEALLAHLGIEGKVSLVLHDWGGMIGMAWAARHPERVGRVALMNTAAFRLPAAKGLPWQLWVTRRTWVGALLTRGLNAFCRGAASACVTRGPMSPEVRAGYLAPYDSWANRIAVLRFVQRIPLHPGDPEFGTIEEVEAALEGSLAEVPMLVCWGMKDFVFDHHFLGEWERRCPRATVHRYPESGHYLLEDEPEAVPARIREFLC
jgi:haloalkane dehalogenase